MTIRLVALGALVLALIAGACGSSSAPVATAGPTSAAASASPATLATAVATLAATGGTPSATALATAGATAVPSVLPSATPAPTPPPTASSTPVPTPVPTPEPTASRTPLPPNSPKPTRTLKPGETPRGTPADISSFLKSRLDLTNLGDHAVTVEVALADENGGSPNTVLTATLEPFDSINQDVFAGTYLVTFTRPGGSPKPVSCSLKIADGDAVSFWATDSLVAIAKEKSPPKKPGDIIVGTSPLCES